MVVLASFVLVALAVAEADLTQFGHGVIVRKPTRNVGPILNSRKRNFGSFITAGTVAPVTTAQPQDDSNIDYYDYYGKSEYGISEQAIPKQPPNTCDSGCDCTKQGGFCIPHGQACTNPVPGEGDCKPSNTGCKCCLQPTVYKQDIENTVAYFIRNLAVYNLIAETNWTMRTLDQTDQSALSNITKTFEQNLPLNPPFKRFLNCLSDRLPTQHRYITGHYLTQIYFSCDGVLPTVREWIGCKNYLNPGIPKPTWQSFRSYPCGVWTTFHTISVKLSYEKPQQDGTIILQTLHKMVKHFPWCRKCMNNFLKMYNDTTLDNGADTRHTSKEAVMWLWKGHNRVTARTASAPSKTTNCLGSYKGTDQGRSQWQFPGVHQCPGCQSSIPASKHCGYPQSHQFDGCFKHDHNEVYNYLRTMYDI